MLTRKCTICGKSFNISRNRIKTAKFCSNDCKFKGQIGSKSYWEGKERTKETREKISKNLKGNIPWNKGKKQSEETKKKISESVKKTFKDMDFVPWNKGKTGVYSEETLQKIKDARAKQIFPKGKNHWHWKDNPSYSAVHKWLVREYGNPQICELCGNEGEYIKRKDGSKFWTIEWANKTGQYIKDIKHYFGLCVKCHINYDKGRKIY